MVTVVSQDGSVRYFGNRNGKVTYWDIVESPRDHPQNLSRHSEAEADYADFSLSVGFGRSVKGSEKP